MSIRLTYVLNNQFDSVFTCEDLSQILRTKCLIHIPVVDIKIEGVTKLVLLKELDSHEATGQTAFQLT